MAERLSIPEEFQAAFGRLVKLLPYQLQGDVQTQNSVWVYFKFGGEQLARHGIEIIRKRFQEKIKANAEAAVISESETPEDDLHEETEKDDELGSDPDDLDDALDDNSE